MAGDRQASTLEGLIDELAAAAEEASGEVSVADVMDKVGQRSFGPLLLVPALVALTPLGGIPGLPTALAVFVVIVAGQLLAGRHGFWLPQVLMRRSVKPDKLKTSVSYARPVARIVDKVLSARLDWLTRAPFIHIAAGVCILVALTVPPMEVVPFAGTVSWVAIAAFGLALIAHDGLVMLIASAFAAGAGYLVVTTLM